jgi:hypothetical protein
MARSLSAAQQAALAKGRAIGAGLGGKAVAGKKPPPECPRCGKPTGDRGWHSYLGHLGLHGLADRYFGGDIQAAQEHLRHNGLARQDAAPWNGAVGEYKPLPGR